MAKEENVKVAGLMRLRKSLVSSSKAGTGVSELMLARVQDSCGEVLTGQATQDQIKDIFDSVGESKGNVDYQALLDLIDEAIASVQQQVVKSVAQPGVASQDTYFQGLVSQAMFSNKWVKLSLVLLGFLYLFAAALLLYPIHKAFDRAGQAGEILAEAEAKVVATQRQLDAATSIHDEFNQRIQGFRAEYAAVEDRIESLNDEIAGVEVLLVRRQGAFQQSIDSMERHLRNVVATTAGENIARIPEQVKMNLEPRIEQAEELVGDQLSALDNSQQSIEDINARIGNLDEMLKKREEGLNAEIDSKIRELFSGRDQQIRDHVKSRTDEITNPHLENLQRKTTELENLYAQQELGLRGRMTNLHTRIVGIESDANNLEGRRNKITSSFNSLAQTTSKIDQLDERLNILEADIAESKKLIDTISEGAEPVAILLAQFMAISHQEIADQLWLVLKTDYLMLAMATVLFVFLVWLIVLSWVSRHRRPPMASGE